MTIEVSNILIQLSMFTEYSNIVWQLKTEIILMHNWQCLLNTPILYDNWRKKLYSYNCQCWLNTPILYDNWRQKLYSYNCQCLLNTPILYDNWSQQYTHTIVNVYWILQYCMTIEDRNYTHAQLTMFTKYTNIVLQKTEIMPIQLSMFTKYSNIVLQLKTEIIPIQLSMFTKYSNVVWQLKTEIIIIELSMFTEYSHIVWQLKTEIILMHKWQYLLNTPILYDNWRQKLYSCTIDNVY